MVSDTASTMSAIGETFGRRLLLRSLRSTAFAACAALFIAHLDQGHAQRQDSQIQSGQSTPERLAYYQLRLHMFQQNGDLKGQLDALFRIADIYDDLRDFDKTLEYYKLALAVATKTNDRQQEAVALNDLGFTYDESGQKQKALDYYGQAVPVLEALGESAHEGVTLNSMGAVYFDVGQLHHALEYYEKALRTEAEARDEQGRQQTLNNIAIVYEEMGETDRALDTYAEALTAAKRSNDSDGQAVTLSNLGLAFERLGLMDKAAEYFRDSIAEMEQLHNAVGRAKAVNNLGLIYLQLGEPLKALDSFKDALQTMEVEADVEAEEATLGNMGQAYIDLGDQGLALETLNKAKRIAEQINDRAGVANALESMAAVYAKQGNHTGALATYKQALTLERVVSDRHGEASDLGETARLELLDGDLPQARADIESAIQIIESLRTKISVERMRISYFSTVESYYELYIELLMRLHAQQPGKGFDRLAFETSERRRARTLLEMLASAHASIRQGVDPELLEQEKSLQTSIDGESAHLTRLLNQQGSEAVVAPLKKELDDLLDQYGALQARIRSTSPHYAALAYPQPLTVAEIQTHVLDGDTELLEYSLGQDRSYLWLITRDSISSFVLPPRREIAANARDFYSELTQSTPLSQEQLSAVERKLSEQLVDQAGTLLNRKRLVIVADEVLDYVPFGLLTVPASSRGRAGAPTPLGTDREIVYLPSASTLAELRVDTANRALAPKSVAVLADPVFSATDSRVHALSSQSGPAANATIREEETRQLIATSYDDSGGVRGSGIRRLRYSRLEADQIASLLPREQMLKAVDFAASKALAISPKLSEYRIIHFATHGLLDNEHPELSGIVLSLLDEKGTPEDGFLRLEDIYNLKLSADLVVLSACQTGLGQQIRGEGVVGLTRGFMFAGTPRVIVSLWSVDDEATAELMQRFYKALLTDGLLPAAALLAAQNSVRQQTRWSQPYYWAGFVLQGDWK